MKGVWHSSELQSYGIAVGTVLLGVLGTVATWPLLEEMPFTLLFLAVMVSGWYGGLGPGILATLLAIVASAFFFFSPLSALFSSTSEELSRIGVFTLLALLMSLLNDARYRVVKILRESESRFQQVFDLAAVPALLLTLDGRFLRVNQALCALFGYPEAALLTRTFQDLTYAADRGLTAEHFQQVLSGAPPASSIEQRFIHRQGQCIWGLVSCSLLRDKAGVPLYFVAQIQDITARKHLEAALQQERDLLQVTLTSIGDAVITTDPTAAVTFLNPVAETLTGWSVQEAMSRPLSEIFPIIHEQTRQPMTNPVKQVIREGRTVELADHTALIARDGHEWLIADSGAPIRDTAGHIYGVVLVFRDVTESKRAEASLLQAKEAAEAADRLKSEFLATMSHELRTPLNVILGYTEMLLDGAVGDLSASQAELLRRIDRNSRVLFELISMVLDLNRLEAGRLPVEVKAVSVAEMVSEIRAELQGFCDQSGLVFTWAVAEGIPLLHTDPGKLKVIMKNLLSNAVKFTKEGSIAIAATQEAGGVELRVTDSGLGIPADAQAIIFEPFRQVDSSDTRPYSGSGLGLHIVQRLLELLDGRISVESELGVGSTFRVWLPLSPPR